MVGSPQIQEADAVIQQKVATVALEQARVKSNVIVRGGVYYDAESELPVALAGLSIPISVYDKNQGKIKRAQADYSATVRRREEIRLRLEQCCAQLYQVYQTTREESIVYRD